MKKCVLIVTSVVILVIVSSFMVFAGGRDSDCPPTGTWYGGSYFPDHAGFNYQYTFIPVEAGRFLLTAEGA
jgi:opacity protein-like surface antigen